MEIKLDKGKRKQMGTRAGNGLSEKMASRVYMDHFFIRRNVKARIHGVPTCFRVSVCGLGNGSSKMPRPALPSRANTSSCRGCETTAAGEPQELAALSGKGRARPETWQSKGKVGGPIEREFQERTFRKAQHRETAPGC